MDYKKILKNENTRYKILRFFSWVPDKFMLKFQYKIKTGRKLDIDNPRRYTEKLQWMKCYYRDELMKKCADKWNVREYVQERNLGCILNHSYGVFESVEKIPWEILPNEFVIKDTLGGGGRSIIIVRNKKKIKMNNVISIINAWLNTSVEKKNLGREWVYDNRKHRILIENLLIADENGDLPDYKFFCFNGKVYCLYMMKNYTLHHDQGILGFLDRDFNLMPVHRADFKPMIEQPEKPENYQEMVRIAEILSKGFPHVRVDLYNIKGQIIFGEMTFFNASGYVQFEPDSFDFELGKQFVLPEKNN